MCGRYTLYKDIGEIEQFLKTMERYGDYSPNYNVAPTHIMPVCYENENGIRILENMHWGFMGWRPKTGTKPFLPINTRSDSLLNKPMWLKAVKQRRCIVPANGFYEWSGSKGNRNANYIYPVKEAFFGFAGIYSELSPNTIAAECSFSIITTKSNSIMEDIHERMPVILHPTEFSEWLNPENTDPNYMMDFLKPYPDDAIKTHIVSNACGNVRNNYESLIHEIEK